MASELNGVMEIPLDKTVTLDLNGHTISRGLTAGTEDGFAIDVKGRLTLKDSTDGGTITGGFNTGNGGAIRSSGTLVIQGGTITGNQASQGGGIFCSEGTLTLSGAPVVSGNTGETCIWQAAPRLRSPACCRKASGSESPAKAIRQMVLKSSQKASPASKTALPVMKRDILPW